MRCGLIEGVRSWRSGCVAFLVTLIAGWPAVGIAQADTASGEELLQHCLELAGISQGVCAMVGCADQGVPLAMARSGDFFLHAQDPRPDNLAAARTAIDRAGLYGKRAVVERGGFGWLPYANRTIDLILAIDLNADQLAQLSPHEVLRALRPGGVAIVGRQAGLADATGSLTAPRLREWLATAGIETSGVIEDEFGVWAHLTRPPLPGTDSWSHWEHGPDNNPVSTDSVIKAPYMTQWLGLPLYVAMPAITTSAGGRLFIAMGHIAHHKREEPWLNTILARSGYNGHVLWKRKLPDGYLAHRSAFIATEDTFYMINPDGPGCLLLDPETGDLQDRITVAELDEDEWKWMAIQNGVLFALAGERKGPAETTVVRSQQPHWSWGELSRGYYEKRVPWGFGTTVLAYDLNRRELLWSHREGAGIDSRAMVLGEGRVYFYRPDSHVGALDAATGQEVWANSNPDVIRLIEEPGRGLSSTPGFRSACFSISTPGALVFEAQTRMNVVALSTTDGKLLWQHRKTTNNPNMIYTDGRLYVGVGADGNTLAIDPLSGAKLDDLGFKKRSCARLTATPDSFFCRGWPEGLTRYDRGTGKVLFNGAFRPSCNDGVVPANGLLYVGPWACDCNLSVMGRVALASASEFEPVPQATAAPRLEKGEGDLDRVEPLVLTDQDWPTYRANTSRTAASRASTSGPLSRIWEFSPDPDHRPTAASAAGGFVFVAGDDGKVRAIDASTGRLVWSFLTAGPILQPPTISEGRAYVGSGDGHVYALEAKTGRLLWRFRVAPVDRRIMVYGSLCSTWPVNSGVLVEDGVAFAAAGIIDYDGTYVCALDAVTGDVKWLNEGSGHLDPALRKGVSAQGTLTIADGRLWMAGGNVVSPAAYDLETGQYLAELPADGSPRLNRGEEVAIFNDRYVLLGGRLRYSAVRNVVNPGKFSARAIGTGDRLGAPRQINNGKIAPAWDAELLAAVDGRETPLECFRVEQVQQFLEAVGEDQRPSRLWIAAELKGSDTVSIAVARDAVLAVSATPKPRDWRATWNLCSFDRDNGDLISRQRLPSEALPGGLLVDRDGRVIVVMQDGRLACFGSVGVLETSINSVVDQADLGSAQHAAAVSFLRETLKAAQTVETHELARAKLESLGVRIDDQAANNGCITRWHIIGDFPWSSTRHPLDTVYVKEPNIDVSQSHLVGERSIRWREFVTDDPDGKLDLVELVGSRVNVAAYAYAEVTLPEAGDLLLKIGSNDGFKCWFNGEEVGRYEGGRGYSPDQNALSITAHKGINKVLLKITQHGAAWAFSARFTDLSGTPINLARAEPETEQKAAAP